MLSKVDDYPLSLTRSTSPGPGPLLTVPSQDRVMIPFVSAARACCPAVSMRASRGVAATHCSHLRPTACRSSPPPPLSGRSISVASANDYDAVKIFMPTGAKKPVIVPYVEHVPPDVTAGSFWMKNRDPAHWRDAWQLEHVTGKYIISDKPLSEEEWIKQRAVVVDGDDAIDVTPALENKSK